MKEWREAGKVSFEGTAGGWDLCLLDIFNVFPRCSVVVGKGCLRRPGARFSPGSLCAFSNGGHCLSRFPYMKTGFPPVFWSPTLPSSFSKHALTSDPIRFLDDSGHKSIQILTLHDHSKNAYLAIYKTIKGRQFSPTHYIPRQIHRPLAPHVHPKNA